MGKVKIYFYSNYGSKKIKTIHNVIPSSIRMDRRKNILGKYEKYLHFTIEDVIKHYGSFTLEEDTLFSIYREDGVD